MILEMMFQLLKKKYFLALLLVINIGGTIYGFIWYEGQLAVTPGKFLIFVPDSPTASLMFCFVLTAFLFRKNWPLLEAFAAVTLLKYGVWAVVMIVAAVLAGDTLTWKQSMLIVSHLGMAVQGLLYSPYYRIKLWHLGVIAAWTLLNDFIDYYYGMHPWVSRLIQPYIDQIAVFTVCLSIVSLLTVFLLNKYAVKRTV
ncbi:Uncharacterized membrane protein YpjA [Evansella caseinilytica]|uniref:Uncharacterized membrane protein YpjA n=1 Tax=Evansella caseinilytica TaxID=1503961 RepID=A0A1H3NGD8_9BACI|nr:DUF1405 domain-containing protein [Evansella caseinilytica]SDY87803.1 Uncharacterized membrane protein YpjA [Evansella caseinilytica]